jgi:ATP-binding cassette subfamily F protein 3
MVFVSHDRYFLDGLATKVLEIGNQKAIPYLGNYEDYLFKKQAEQEREQAAAIEEPGEEDSTKNGDGPEAQARARKRKVNPYKIQQLSEKIEGVEARIHTHETRIAVLGQMLASESLYRDYQLFRTTMDEHDRLQEELTHLMGEWESLQSELAKLQA